MNTVTVHSLLRKVSITTLIALAALTGCSSSPSQPDEEALPEEAMAEEAPLQEAPPQQEQTPPAAASRPVAAAAEPLVLAKNHPERYVVRNGDTLWGIAEAFLRDPWRWPEVWQGNSQVSNPHLIFPGDALTVMMIDGRPVMQVERGPVAVAAGVPDTAPSTLPPPPPPRQFDSQGRPLKVVKLKPEVRVIDLDKAIPTIPMDAIRQFLNQSMVVEPRELNRAPYVLAFADEHISGGSGYSFYARGIKDEEPANYMVVRPGKEYRDPDSGSLLGYEALFVGDAQIERMSDPVKLTLKKTTREALRGDRLIPGQSDPMEHAFYPHAPENDVKGKIVSAFEVVNQIGQYQVVVISLGKKSGMEPGHVLAVYQTGQPVKDPVRGGSVRLPDERAGTAIVVRSFERVSYALVLRAVRAIHLGDTVKNP